MASSPSFFPDAERALGAPGEGRRNILRGFAKRTERLLEGVWGKPFFAKKVSPQQSSLTYSTVTLLARTGLSDVAAAVGGDVVGQQLERYGHDNRAEGFVTPLGHPEDVRRYGP